MASLLRKLPKNSVLASTFLRNVSKDLCHPFIAQNEALHYSTWLIVCRSSPILTQRLLVGCPPATSRMMYTTKAAEEDKGLLVYQGRQGKLFKSVKIFSLCTSGIGLAVQPYLLMKCMDMSLAASIPIFGVVNMFVFANPFMIHYIAKKYVQELYFNPESKVFTAQLLTFFAGKKSITFKAEDVEVPDVPGPFTMFKAKGYPLFAHEDDFTSIQVYKHMMGFDRPINISYDAVETKDPKAE